MTKVFGGQVNGMALGLRPAHFISAPIYRTAGYPTNHPLAISRIATVEALCAAHGWISDAMPLIDAPMASFDKLRRFHADDYLNALKNADQRGYASIDDRERFGLGTLENPIFQGLWERAATSVGASLLAADLAHQGAIAYHPGGGTHHGQKARASGFCYFNDPVFAILRLLELGRRHVVYVDLDAHHGDGVEMAFAQDPRVTTLSLHEAGRWPFTGAAAQLGHAANIPVPRGLNDTEFGMIFDKVILPFVASRGDFALVVTVGADSLRGDPLSGLMLSNGALWRAVTELAGLSEAVVVLGGGGYNPWTLARAWAGLWARLTRQSIPPQMPAAARAALEGLACDLVDEDERDPAWQVGVADAPNLGPIRPEIEALVQSLRREFS